jgi:hypothetical protein
MTSAYHCVLINAYRNINQNDLCASANQASSSSSDPLNSINDIVVAN